MYASEPSLNRNQYFATLSTKEIAGELIYRKDRYYKHMEQSGHFVLLKHAHMCYYKAAYVNGRIRRTGENLEYIETEVNHYRNLLQHLLSFVTSQRPQFEPKAANTDYKSAAQTQLASGLLEYYLRAKKLERYIKTATETAVNLGEGWVYAGWNATAGNTYGQTESGAPIYEGDLEFKSYGPLDVIREVTAVDGGPNQWIMIRDYRNKWDLAAKYPELADKIKAKKAELYEDMRFSFREMKEERKDEIPVYCFFHRKSDAVPDGRMVEIIDSDIVLMDGALPYREIPCYRIMPGEKDGSIWGYTNAWDLLPLQQAMDKLHSTVVSNQAAFGIQNIGVPKGMDLNVTQIHGGLNLIEFDPKSGPPIPLQLLSTPAEIFKYIEMLSQTMETLIGVNSVARGNPEASLKSGSALALVQSMAIQFSQNLQQSYAMLLEDLGTAVINLLQDYATVPRIALIAGKSNRSRMREFKGDDVAQIQRVLVDMGNPLMRTTAGRVNIAEQLIQAGLIKTPQEYLEVVTTGRLEPIYECQVAELNLIRAENESMMDGKAVPVIRTDDHQNHINEHKVLLSSPEARQRPQLVQVALQHIQEHEQFLMPVMPQGAELGSGGGSGSSKGSVAETVGAPNSIDNRAKGAKMPGMPTNPVTGQKAPSA